MAITLLQMAEKVLAEEKHALTADEIWQAAETNGLDKLVESMGNTPAASLCALIHADARENSSSRFVTLISNSWGTRYERFILKSDFDNIHPGKRVRILEHVLFNINVLVEAVEVAATKGSIAAILSSQEYWAYVDAKVKDGFYVHPQIRSELSARTFHPVRFEEVVPPSEEDYAHWNTSISHIHVSCQVGAINVVTTESFVVI